MIDYPGQERDRLEDPGVPDDIKYLGNSLDVLSHWMKRIYDALRRQESPNPTIIRLDPGVIFSTSTRMRCMMLVFTGGNAADVMGLKIGAAISIEWINQATNVPFPVPLVLDAGVDVQVVNQTNPDHIWRCYMTAYVELEDGNA